MSFADIAASGWKAFWSNLLAPGTIGLFIALAVICLLLGFAFRRTMSGMQFALRAGSALLAFILIVGFLGVLGIDMNALTPAINWVLEQIHAPLYVKVA
ncbi:hypothetical protein ACTQV2_00685 [Bifidobacterium thermophilum]|uniref:hypothetical protein n=1 Tax=Bifidobacterium thermophilum TaxID=33905 RepID=UPI003F91475E